MNILSIESSCDETAAAIVSGNPFAADDKPTILSNVVVSQIDIFKAYGGVIPEVAARSHLEAILPVIHQAFHEASFEKSGKDDWDKIDAIAVTHTPGLLGSLLIGTLTARTLAILHHKPLYAVHHLKSHIYSNWLGKEGIVLSENISDATSRPLGRGERSDGVVRASDTPVTTGVARGVSQKEAIPSFPLLALVISGGHTQIIRMMEHNDFTIIGTTYDDAVGECFDKVAKILGLPYPGGPSIAKAAKSGNPKKYKLPHPKIKDLDFSFSGLKTAVLRAVQKEVGVPISYPSHELAKLLTKQQVADFAASFEDTACDILLEKLQKAIEKYPDTKSLVFAGGVSANECLRKKTARTVFFPNKAFSGDNAAMVGAAAFYEIASNVKPTDPKKLNILPRSTIQ